MRIIKTQCGKMIVNVDKLESIGITRHQGFEDGTEYQYFYVTAHKVSDLGYYATEIRAIKALELLTEWLTIEPRHFLKEHQHYQMPQDGEELDK